MATASTVPGSQPEYRGFSYWMERALKERERLLDESGSDPDVVHDLRVALRRCGSVADVLAEVDPDPGWPLIRKLAKRLFHALGDLRDAQVLEEWTSKLGANEDPVSSILHSRFESAEPELREAVSKAADKFDGKEWKRLERHLRSRARLVPPGGAAAECLALERIESAIELHKRALRSETPAPWHELRIGIKRLRYTTESLLPQHYTSWSQDLKRLQDLLGEVHDLDVLRGLVEKVEAREAEESASVWQETILRERNERIETYRQLTLGKNSLWQAWRAGLPSNGKLEAAILARFRATARAVDSHPRRTSQVSRIALGVFDALNRASLLRSPHQTQIASMRRTLRIAARLQNLGRGLEGKKKNKAGQKALRNTPKPPGWSAEEWAVLSWTLRYQRGAEPKPKHQAFHDLGASARGEVLALAGILRLSRALRKVGIATGAGVRAESLGSAVVVRVPSLPDSEEFAARIGAAKHLLQTYLANPLSVYPAKKPEPIQMNRVAGTDDAEPVLPFAAASD